MGRSGARVPARAAGAAALALLLLPLLLFTCFSDAKTLWLKVDQKVVSYEGEMVNLTCQLISETKETVWGVLWQLKPEIDLAFWSLESGYPTSPLEGRVSFINTPPDLSISIKDVKLTDQGEYSCLLYSNPSGRTENFTTVTVLAKPINTASPVTVVAGAGPAVVARCTSTSDEPAVQISWVTVVSGNASSTVDATPNSTVTVTSEFWLVPTVADNGKDISCVIDHRSQKYLQTIAMRLSIEYAPKVMIEGYDDDWYVGRTDAQLVCQADGNPPPFAVTWTVLSGLMPDTVQVKENTLTVLKVDDSVKTTFVCEASNHLGVGQQQLVTAVRDKPRSHQASLSSAITGGVTGVVLLLVSVGAALWFLCKHHQNMRTHGFFSRETQTSGGSLEQTDSAGTDASPDKPAGHRRGCPMGKTFQVP